nr:MAG TPA_asm: hypothetical protein [Caudoviricetes sp.]
MGIARLGNSSRTLPGTTSSSCAEDHSGAIGRTLLSR